MLPEILEPEHKITRQDAAMLSRMADPKRGWCERLSDEVRQALIVKMVGTMEECRKRGDDNALKIYARLMGVLARFAEIDAKAAQEPAPQQHLHLHGELATMTADELRAYRERIRNDIATGGA